MCSDVAIILDAMMMNESFDQFRKTKVVGGMGKEASDDDDDEHIYANVLEMERESKRRKHPMPPEFGEEPSRDLGGGWFEYFTNSGRPYFFNPESGECHWKPPRFLKPPSEVKGVLNGDKDNLNGGAANEFTLLDETLPSCSMSLSALSNALNRSEALENIEGKSSSAQTLCRSSNDSTLSKSGDSEEIKTNSAYSSSNTNYLSSKHFSQRSIRCGTVEKCKISDAGMRVKKKEWSVCYLFLSSAHIIFYKDEKSAEKSGRHYEAPLGMCDLRGANIQWVNEKDKRRKHVFQLTLIDKTVYLFSTTNSQDVNAWFHSLRQVVSKLPRPDSCPTPVLERDGGSSNNLVRNLSNISHTSNTFTASQTRRSLKKSKTLSKDIMIVSSSEDDRKARGSVEEGRPTRDSIIEKLKRFFRSRPSIESLKEKGIYKTEPVFGSTLAAICQHEQTTVPKFIQVVTDVIESKGLETDGLYRVSGNLSSIQRIRCQVDQEKYGALLAEDDVHVLTGALKLFFRELSEPIFPIVLAKDFIHANRLSNGESKVKIFDDLLRKLPLVNRETLKVLFGHLIRVASHADKNRMEIHNLAIMFGPSLFSSGNEVTAVESKKKSKSGSDKKMKEKPVGVQSNSHLAFNMIMQGQTVEYLLKEYKRFTSMQRPSGCTERGS